MANGQRLVLFQAIARKMDCLSQADFWRFQICKLHVRAGTNFEEAS